MTTVRNRPSQTSRMLSRVCVSVCVYVNSDADNERNTGRESVSNCGGHSVRRCKQASCSRLRRTGRWRIDKISGRIHVLKRDMLKRERLELNCANLAEREAPIAGSPAMQNSSAHSWDPPVTVFAVLMGTPWSTSIIRADISEYLLTISKKQYNDPILLVSTDRLLTAQPLSALYEQGFTTRPLSRFRPF